MSGAAAIGRYKQKAQESSSILPQLSRPNRTSKPLIPDTDAYDGKSTQVTLRDQDNRTIAHVSRETYLLSHAMMNAEHSLGKKPQSLDIANLPYGLRDEFRDDDEMYAKETQVPESRRNKVAPAREAQPWENRSSGSRKAPPTMRVPVAKQDTYRESREEVRPSQQDDSRNIQQQERYDTVRQVHKPDHSSDFNRYDTREEDRHSVRSRNSRTSAQKLENQLKYDVEPTDRVIETSSVRQRDVDSRSQRSEPNRYDREESMRRPERRQRDEREWAVESRDTSKDIQISDLRFELQRYQGHGHKFEMPPEGSSLYVYETLYEKLTIQIMTQHRVQFVQTVIRVVGGFIYVALKLMGAWWMDGWIVSLSNELEDPQMQPALESFYIRFFGYARQSPTRMLMWSLAKVTMMTIMANLTSNTIVSNFFDGYGKNARVKDMKASVEPAAEVKEDLPAVGGNMMPKLMQTAAKFMPTILSSLSSGGGFGSILGSLGSMLGGGNRPAQPSQPVPQTVRLPSFSMPSL